tara:strand:- start:190 stop:3819 length:3630 start_codon:yes stop_codon:yes gene_type:complete
MELKTKSLETAIKGTGMFTGSLSKFRSRTWYADNLDKALHQNLKHYEDALEYCKKHKDEKVYGVYLRFVKGQIVKVKIGKGVVYYIEHEKKARLTRDHNSADEQPLETKDGGAFIPCVDEMAALALEDAVHKFFGKLEGVHNSIDNKFSVVETRWLKPGVNSEGGKGGTENFNFEDIWETKVDIFVQAVESVTKQSQINKRNFAKLARDSQVSGSDLLCEWLLNGGSMQDFFLLMKPRAGKNTTMFWGISKYVEIIKKENPNKTIIVDFLSLWPSAFSGGLKDIKDYYYINGITLAGVNTSEENWQTELEKLLNDSTIDAVFRFASLQSIDSEIAKAYNDDEDREGAEIDYVPSKAEYFKSNIADLCVIDESDHGMRTTRSTDVLEAFGYTKRVWMSGTDLYALKNKIVFNPVKNHFVYDILDEVQDVIAGKIKMPRMKKHSLIAKLLPFEDLDKDTMNEKEITRKIVALFETVAKGKWKYDKVSDRFVDIDSKEFKFKNFSEVKLFWEKIYYWRDDIAGASSDTPNPTDLNHLFCCMPSVASCMALYNHIKNNDIDCIHEVLLANKFNSAEKIEQQVNDAMVGKNTIFLTVGKMLRGAKAPWNGVLRFDKYSDYKVGLQLELRGQNTNEDWFHVYDANCFRSQSMKYELIKSRSTGTKIYSDGKKLHNLIPMTRKGEFEEKTVSWDDCVSSWQAGKITEGFKRDSLFDEQGLIDAHNLLDGATKTSDNQKGNKDDREGSERGKKTITKGLKSAREKDDLKLLKAQAKTLSTMLPILLVISDCKYKEIDTLIKNTSTEDLSNLLRDKCNIKNIDKGFKKKIIKMFNAEEINHQLYITSKKLDNGAEINWSEFSNQGTGDVITPKDCVEHIIQTLPIKSCKTFLDPACGFGEMIIGLVHKGYNGKILICDRSMLNIKITIKRLKLLGIDKFEYFVYNNFIEFEKKIIEKNMKFDVILTNPPYNSDDTADRGKDLQSKVRGQGDNLAKKFTYLNLSLLNENGHMVSIMPYGHRTYSDSVAEHYKKNGLCKIDNVSEYFPSVRTSPCAFYFDKQKNTDDIEDNFKSHNFTVPVNNIGKIFKNQPGYLNRQEYESKLQDSGKFRIVITTSIQKYTDDESIIHRMKDNTRGYWRVIFNCTTSVGKWGKIIVEGPQSTLSKSVHCLVCNSEEQAKNLKEYLESEKVKNILSIVKLNSCNSKKFLKYIPMLEEKNG